MRTKRRPFLTAEWRHLAMLSYRADPALLAPLVPAGTELDLWRDQALVSIVGFQFLQTRVRGLAIPYHQGFEEVNLRFYTKRLVGGELRRGVTFIRELVPRRAIATAAQWTYNEPYTAVPMRSSISMSTSGAPATVTYEWRTSRSRASDWCSLRVAVHDATPTIPDADSDARFVTEHYWGYTRQRDGSTLEYEVEHPRWRVRAAADASLHGDLTALYGDAFAGILQTPPCSAFLADGSAVTVFDPVALEAGAGGEGLAVSHSPGPA
ncbi:MAG TPA: DUF2071 domain-containing protein [Vicinamibacterales bacterium]|nr:DUF2071 domain-containing protein [Vicinamibacterales bacterium]